MGMARKDIGGKESLSDAELSKQLRGLFDNNVPYGDAAKTLGVALTDAFMQYQAFERGFKSRADLDSYLKLRSIYSEGVPSLLDRLPTAGYPIETMSSLKRHPQDDYIIVKLSLQDAGDSVDLERAVEDISDHIKLCALLINERLSGASVPEGIEVTCSEAGICIKPGRRYVGSRAFMHAYDLVLRREIVDKAEPSAPEGQ